MLNKQIIKRNIIFILIIGIEGLAFGLLDWDSVISDLVYIQQNNKILNLNQGNRFNNGKQMNNGGNNFNNPGSGSEYNENNGNNWYAWIWKGFSFRNRIRKRSKDSKYGRHHT